MIVTWRLCAALASALAVGACATTSPLVRQDCSTPDAQLAALLKPLEELRAKGCTPECGQLEREIDRLAVVCPGHVPTLMANAIVASDDHPRAKSQQWLDLVLARPGIHPDAGVLRARIAIEEGNLPFARRLLEQQIQLTPDHAGLHEAYGGALYLDRQLKDARRELTTAAALGAPGWRVAYHLGLVEEAEGHVDEAIARYADAVQGNPGWAPAQSRLNGLRAGGRPRR